MIIMLQQSVYKHRYRSLSISMWKKKRIEIAFFQRNKAERAALHLTSRSVEEGMIYSPAAVMSNINGCFFFL